MVDRNNKGMFVKGHKNMNNNIQNLEMIKNSEHTKLHWERGDIRCAQ